MYLNPHPLSEQALPSNNPGEEEKLTQALFAQSGEVEGSTAKASKPVGCRFTGHLLRLRLVVPSGVTPHKMNTVEGYAVVLHAVAHIEFGAINLTSNAAYRFHNMPSQFVCDWVRMAKREVSHFGLMYGHLNSLGCSYGDFETHGHLWNMAHKTAYDPLLHMILVPRVLEACGLDVMPGIHIKVTQYGDMGTCDMLDTIYCGKVGRVAIGSHWYQHLCRERGLEPIALFHSLTACYDIFIFRGYVNIEARERAGFSRFEPDMLEDFKESLRQDKKTV